MKNTTVKGRRWYSDDQVIEITNYILDDRISKISNSIKFELVDKNELKKINKYITSVK